MTFHAQLASPLGAILLCSDGEHLTGLYFIGQKDCPALRGLPPPRPADPTAGLMSGMPLKHFKAYRLTPSTDLPSTDLFSQDNLRRTAASAAGPDGGPAMAGKRMPEPRSRQTVREALSPLSLAQDDAPAGAKAVFEQTRQELGEYFSGSRRTFSIPLRLEGTDFQKKVWRALLDIPYGECVSYGDVAVAAGLTAQHGRPVGTAVGRNPITIIVPCHRVLANTGRLNGYTGGLERKFALLELEGFTLR